MVNYTSTGWCVCVYSRQQYVKKIFLYMGQGEWSLLGFFFFSKRESGNDARILKREKVMLASAFACSVASLTGVLVRVLCASDPDSC